ncbi:MAG: hypothetical protein ACI97A_003639 [Planctomycetota bacterium]|jgi:hypothetical protein
MNGTFRSACVLVFGVLILMAVGTAQERVDPAKNGDQESLPRPEERWPSFLEPESSGIYINGTKCGFLHITKVRDVEAKIYLVRSELEISIAASEDNEAGTYRMTAERRFSDQAPYPLIGGFDEVDSFGDTELYELRADPLRVIATIEGVEKSFLATTREVLVASELLSSVEPRLLRIGFGYELRELDLSTGVDEVSPIKLTSNISIPPSSDPSNTRIRLTFEYKFSVDGMDDMLIRSVTDGNLRCIEESIGSHFKVITEPKEVSVSNIEAVDLDKFLVATGRVLKLDEGAARDLMNDPTIERPKDQGKRDRRKKSKKWRLLAFVGLGLWFLLRRKAKRKMKEVSAVDQDAGE